MPAYRSRWLAAGLIAALAGCTPPGAVRDEAAPVDPAPPTALELALGQRSALPGGGALRYIALVSDSRCPAGVQCVHAGEAVLRFELEAGGRARAFELSTAAARNTATIDGRRISLLDVSRDIAPRARVAVERVE